MEYVPIENAESELVKKNIIARYEHDIDTDGKQIFRTRSFSVAENATEVDMYNFAHALFSLSKKYLIDVEVSAKSKIIQSI